ncbi:MAG: DUF4878 domain-containing protein [Arachidicoccus sp.]|nr:DUF4878 domain-containing protein [Arachidicoccus sp.]
MKNYFFVCMIAASLLFSIRSKGQIAEGSPSDVASKFTKALLRLDVKDAEKYADSNAVALLEQAAPAIESQKTAVPDSIRNILSNAKITASNEKINNDSATVSLTTTFEKELQGTKEKTETVSLIKQAGIWKVLLGLPEK